MVPLSAVVNIRTVLGADAVNAYNEYPAVLINGAAAPGASSGQAIAAMEHVSVKHLPAGYAYEWTGMSYQQLLRPARNPPRCCSLWYFPICSWWRCMKAGPSRCR